MTITKWDTDGTPADQDCPECNSKSSVVLGDSGLWKCESCSTIFDWQQIEEVHTKCGQTFRFPVKAKNLPDDFFPNLYIESLGGIGRMPDSFRELGDTYWNSLTEKQLLSWVEVITFSLQAAYDEIEQIGTCNGKSPSLSSLRPDLILSDTVDITSKDADGTFDIVKDDHFFLNVITWSDLKWLGIWAIGRLLDKELIKRAKARVAS